MLIWRVVTLWAGGWPHPASKRSLDGLAAGQTSATRLHDMWPDGRGKPNAVWVIKVALDDKLPRLARLWVKLPDAGSLAGVRDVAADGRTQGQQGHLCRRRHLLLHCVLHCTAF